MALVAEGFELVEQPVAGGHFRLSGAGNHVQLAGQGGFGGAQADKVLG